MFVVGQSLKGSSLQTVTSIIVISALTMSCCLSD